MVRQRSLRRSAIEAAARHVAARQHGVVTRSQLTEAGIPSHAIDHRVRDGRLVALYRGVYRVPGPLRSAREREMAAVLAAGPGAVLSHWSAASLWELLRGGPSRGGASGGLPPVEVTVAGRHPRPGVDVRVHIVARLDPADVTVLDGIPITKAARTILDLAATATPRQLEQALAAADRRGAVDRDQVAEAVARDPRRRGAGALRALIGSPAEAAFTRSRAEDLMLGMIRQAGLVGVRTNAMVEGLEVDFLWPRERLIVEVDGRAYHDVRGAFSRDRRRDSRLGAAGYRVLRVTWDRLRDEPFAVVADIARALVR